MKRRTSFGNPGCAYDSWFDCAEVREANEEATKERIITREEKKKKIRERDNIRKRLKRRKKLEPKRKRVVISFDREAYFELSERGFARRWT